MEFCHIHKGRIAVGTCALCRKGTCSDCQVVVKGKYYCKPCAAQALHNSESASHRNPLVAAVLSLVLPGIGQVYNGQTGKGVLIFLSFWLILPWLYGILDAYRTAVRVNRSEIRVNPSTGCLTGCLVMAVCVVFSPLYVSEVFKRYSVFLKGRFDESFAVQTLKTISAGAEQYVRDTGAYPETFSDLYFSDPPYIEDLFCGVIVKGVHFSCVFSKNGYTVTARPASSLTGEEAALMITTGGRLTISQEEEGDAR